MMSEIAQLKIVFMHYIFLLVKLMKYGHHVKLLSPQAYPEELNDKIYECNIRLLNKYLGTDVQICDNSCF